MFSHNPNSEPPQDEAFRPDDRLALVHCELLERISACQSYVVAISESSELRNTCLQILTESREELNQCVSRGEQYEEVVAELRERHAQLYDAFQRSLSELRAAEKSFIEEVSAVCRAFDIPDLRNVLVIEVPTIESIERRISLDVKPIHRIMKALTLSMQALQKEGCARKELSPLDQLKEQGLGEIAHMMFEAAQEYVAIPRKLRRAKALHTELEALGKEIDSRDEDAELYLPTVEHFRKMISRTEDKLISVNKRIEDQVAHFIHLADSSLEWLRGVLSSSDVSRFSEAIRQFERLKVVVSCSSVDNFYPTIVAIQDAVVWLRVVAEGIESRIVDSHSVSLDALLPRVPEEGGHPPVIVDRCGAPTFMAEGRQSGQIAGAESLRNPTNATREVRAPVRRDDIHIRSIHRRDLPNVLEIENGSFDFPWTKDEFCRCLRQESVIGLVATVKDSVVGYTIYERHESRTHLLSFAVHPGHRHEGIGETLLAKLVAMLPLQHPGRIVLEVRESNLSALGFFKRFGFKATSLLRNFFEDKPEDAILMQYRLERNRNAAEEKER